MYMCVGNHPKDIYADPAYAGLHSTTCTFTWCGSVDMRSSFEGVQTEKQESSSMCCGGIPGIVSLLLWCSRGSSHLTAYDERSTDDQQRESKCNDS